MLLLRRRSGLAFLAHSRGNVALVFALVAPLLVATSGAAIDYTVSRTQLAELQAAADAAAIAGARELALTGAGHEGRVDEAAKATGRAALANAMGPADIKIEATVIKEKSEVRVDITQSALAYFAGLVSEGSGVLHATATARTMGEKICVISLEESKGDGIRLQNSATLSAGGCSVYANSTDPQAIRAEDSSRLMASNICSAGGYKGLESNFRPLPLTDCPPIDDPLAARPQPEVGPCLSGKLDIHDETTTLLPGTYCGDIMIHSKAKVFLLPGIYVIKDGQLKVDSGAELTGEYVGFFFTGDKAKLRFAGDATIDLGAPKEGPMAGILFWEDRASEKLREFRIDTDNARRLLGTIYLPEGRFVVDSKQPVAEESAYTALVVRRLELRQAPNLVLNTDYGATDVPVPTGVGPTGATRLVQ